MFSSRKTGSASNNYLLTRSLRFRSSASAYLDRTPASAGNRKTWTWSAWVKRSNIGTNGVMLGTETVNSQTYCSVYFVSDKIYLDAAASNVETMRVYTNAVFRDPSAWYHVVVYLDTTQATAANRTAIYVNGVLQTLTVSTNPAQNLEPLVNSTVAHNIGRNPLNLQYFDGYMTEVYLIDGQALTPSSFGATDAATGVWQPIKYTGTYGTNGFYLPFTDTSSTTTLGNDFSGNGNNWTTNNISLTAGSTYDSMTDVPTNTNSNTANYCVINPVNISSSSVSVTDGNLNLSIAANATCATATMAVNSGKWYWEFTAGAASANAYYVSVCDVNNWSSPGKTQTDMFNSPNIWTYYGTSGNTINNATQTAYGATFTNGDVIGVALNMDAGTITFYKNNVSQGTAFSTLSGKTIAPQIGNGASGSSIAGVMNFGQRPFSYTPPTGFKALNTYNLPTPTIGATASSQANKYFDATTYSGNSSTQSITNSGSMQPDMVWIKARNTTYNHGIQDAVRGVGKIVYPNLTNAEDTGSTSLTAFNSNGFGLGNDSWNESGKTYVGWQWKANGSGSSNTAGSITSTVSANTTSGFSIVTYTGNATIGATIGHGLGVAPSMLIVKQRTGGTEAWQVYHSALGATKYVELNNTNAEGTNINRWNNTAPTSTVFTVYNDTINNGNTNTYVAYCFAEVAGYSAFGSYTGNGSTDGPFVFTGFRPMYVMVKSTSGPRNWAVLDASRNPSNVANFDLYPNQSLAEITQSTLDFLSNGFKLRVTDSDFNANGETYIYMAFAESPFKYANAR